MTSVVDKTDCELILSVGPLLAPRTLNVNERMNGLRTVNALYTAQMSATQLLSSSSTAVGCSSLHTKTSLQSGIATHTWSVAQQYDTMCSNCCTPIEQWGSSLYVSKEHSF